MPVNKDAKIYVAGHNGMVGSAIVRGLRERGYNNLLLASREELDLTNQAAVEHFFCKHKPDFVYMAAAKVGGIYANNSLPAEFIYQNLMIETNVVHAAYNSGVERLLFLGSSCIYPKNAHQPMTESALLTGYLEPTNEPYAIAKIAGIKLCESYNRQYQTDFRSVMPTNLYGVNDNFHPKQSHVIPGLIQRFHSAKLNRLPEVEIWGSGLPRREFLYVDDMACACIHVMEIDNEVLAEKTANSMCSHINIGFGEDISIKAVAELISEVVGYSGQLVFDQSKPDGTMRKLLDTSLINSLGWKPKISLREGLEKTYEWYCREN